MPTDPTENAILAALAGEDEPSRIAAAIRRLEEYCTPAEFAGALAGQAVLGEAARSALLETSIAHQLAHERPQQYVRHYFADDVMLFHDPEQPRRNKTLLIGFCGRARRLMPPITALLQVLPSDGYDIVALRDHRREHYDHGTEGYADSLLGLVMRLQADLETKRYPRIVTFDTSMGGFPALRAGILIGADQAVSIGGGPAWHIARLTTSGRRPISAFDPLCPCSPAAPPLYCVYPGGNTKDRAAVDGLAAMRPVHRVEMGLSDEHNVLYELWQRQRLGVFLAALFAGDLQEMAAEAEIAASAMS